MLSEMPIESRNVIRVADAELLCCQRCRCREIKFSGMQKQSINVIIASDVK
jgi:hypothetical protein